MNTSLNHNSQKHDQFISASSLQGDNSDQAIILPETMQKLLGNIIDCLQNGAITLLESDEISKIHAELHKVMINAVASNWSVKLIDIANCFNPHLIGALSFPFRAHDILHKISLARPFQIYQCVSIIQQLKEEVRHTQKKVLIIVTNITSQFFDPALEADKNYPLPQLEQLRHTLGILQGLAAQGHTIVITDKIGQHQNFSLFKTKNTGNNNRIQASTLAYIANIHIRSSITNQKREITLKNHPFSKPKTVVVKAELKSKQVDVKQTSLNNWFSN